MLLRNGIVIRYLWRTLSQDSGCSVGSPRCALSAPMEVSASHKRWRHVQRLFAEVVGLDPDRRAARLDRVGGEDPRLREEVEALLARHDRGDPLTGSPARIASGDSLILGEIVGHYCLLEEIGRGAMGIVYRAQDTRLKRPVALKFLSPRLSADKRARARLEREAQAASALDHPNICTVYEIGETDDGRLYLALACYDGETLERKIEQGTLEIDDAIRIAVHVARGLAAAHRHGIVHRDVKPSNILVTESGDVKILDFGIARVADSDLTGTGDTLGTAAYMSPEHLRGQPDARSDVWALGVVLYEMLTGRRPFAADYAAALTFAVLHEPPAPLDRADVPDALVEVAERCLEKDPEERYQTAEEVEVDLERLRLKPGASHPVRRISRRTRRLLFSAGLLLVLLLPPVRTAVMDAFGAGGSPDVQHLAVLPFVSSTAEASVGEGLALTLTDLLTSLGSDTQRPITVVPFSGMRDITTVDSARERFGVDVVVEGDFQQEGDDVHLTLRLTDARTHNQRGVKRLTESVDRLPFLEQQTLAALADMLGFPLSDERQAMLAAGGTADAGAYEWYLKGESALERFDKSENIDRAIDLFQWALEDDSLFALAHAGLGKAYVQKYASTMQAEYVESAKQHGAQALALEDRLAPVRAMLGRLYDLTGDYEMAVREFNRALSLDESYAAAHHGLGEAYRKLGRTSEAEVHLRKAIALQPQYWVYYNDLSAFYLDTGRYDEAQSTSQEVIRLAPDSPWGYNNLGNAFLMQGHLSEARQAFEQAVTRKPYYAAYANLGYIYYTEGRPTDEARAYERALRLDSADFRVWGNLAGAYERSGASSDTVRRTYERAVQGAIDALDVNPNAASTRALLANYLTRLARTDEARLHLDRALTLAPDDADVAYHAGVAYELMGERALALEWIMRAMTNGYPLEWIEKDPELDDLRQDPEFIQWNFGTQR